MTCMRAWMSSKLGRIRPRTTELAALERMEKKSHIHIMGKTMSSHYLRYFDWILFIFVGNEDMHKSLDEFETRPDATTGFHGKRKGLQLEKRRQHVFSNVFDWIHFILAGNDDIH